MNHEQWGDLRALFQQHPLPEQDILQCLGTFHGEPRLHAMTYAVNHLKGSSDVTWTSIFEGLKAVRDEAWFRRVGKINGFHYNYDGVWTKVLHFPNDAGPLMMWKQRDLDDLYTPFRTGSMQLRMELAQDIIASMFSDEFIFWLPESCCIWHTHSDEWSILSDEQRKSIYKTLWLSDLDTIEFQMEMGRDEVRSPDNDDEQIKFIDKAFLNEFILDAAHTLFLCPKYMLDGTNTNDPVIVGMDRTCMVVVWRE